MINSNGTARSMKQKPNSGVPDLEAHGRTQGVFGSSEENEIFTRRMEKVQAAHILV